MKRFIAVKNRVPGPKCPAISLCRYVDIPQIALQCDRIDLADLQAYVLDLGVTGLELAPR
jgi:hypothetical protein